MLRKLPEFTMNWLQPRIVSCLPLVTVNYQLKLKHLAWLSKSSAKGAQQLQFQLLDKLSTAVI